MYKTLVFFAIGAFGALGLAPAAHATSDGLVDFLAIPGSAGLGGLLRMERSPYKQANPSNDMVPLYMYEGKRVFLHASRVGVKLSEQPGHVVDAFLAYRFESFPYDQTPASLLGMRSRAPSVDVGFAYRHRAAWGNVDAEILHDANHTNQGTELHLGYGYDWAHGRLHLRPGLALSRRSANLNNYYYGVAGDEATAARPAYLPGAGTDFDLSLYGYYEVSERWRLLGGVGVTLRDNKVRRSPIVRDAVEPTAIVGLAYDFGGHKPYSEPNFPLHVRVLRGGATDCNFLPVVTLRCTSINTVDNTGISGFEVGRPLLEKVNGWPLDFVGYVGLLHHEENGRQADSWQFNTYIKVFYYGFPWRERVRTRLGMGMGFALAQRVPWVEERDQNRRGRNTSKLLNYLDPSIDISIGDLLGSEHLKQTYIGIGASHRSGIFGTAQLLGNINGGSNYLYAYIESKI